MIRRDHLPELFEFGATLSAFSATSRRRYLPASIAATVGDGSHRFDHNQGEVWRRLPPNVVGRPGWRPGSYGSVSE
jgi:hypothetical protein